MKEAAGLLVYRKGTSGAEVLLTHPGGPFWAKKDTWSIPKGELEPDELPQSALAREFREETGLEPPLDNLLDLGSAKASAKTNHIWAAEADLDVSKFRCDSLVEMEWPPRSGKKISFPENDKAAWIPIGQARGKVYKSQAVFIERLAEKLGIDPDVPPESPEQPQIALDL